MTNRTILHKSKYLAVLDSGDVLYNPRIYEGVAVGHKIGAVYKEVDGYYVWDSSLMTGIWSAGILHEIADTLDALNKTWDEEVRKAGL